MNRHALRSIIACGILALALTPSGATGKKAPVLPPQAHPYGDTYSEWAAAWWQWVFSQPASTNPVLDEDGDFCANEQEGKVWFLAGVLDLGGEEGPVTRECTIPTGTALLIPVANAFSCWAPGEDPAEQDLDFRRAVARDLIEEAHDLHATIDGVPVPDIERYYEESIVFDALLPEDNIFGIPELDGVTLSPCVDAGYYLVVHPLSPGRHTITFGSSFDDFEVDITYHITVSNR